MVQVAIPPLRFARKYAVETFQVFSSKSKKLRVLKTKVPDQLKSKKKCCGQRSPRSTHGSAFFHVFTPNRRIYTYIPV